MLRSPKTALVVALLVACVLVSVTLQPYDKDYTELVSKRKLLKLDSKIGQTQARLVAALRTLDVVRQNAAAKKIGTRHSRTWKVRKIQKKAKKTRSLIRRLRRVSRGVHLGRARTWHEIVGRGCGQVTAFSPKMAHAMIRRTFRRAPGRLRLGSCATRGFTVQARGLTTWIRGRKGRRLGLRATRRPPRATAYYEVQPNGTCGQVTAPTRAVAERTVRMIMGPGHRLRQGSCEMAGFRYKIQGVTSWVPRSRARRIDRRFRMRRLRKRYYRRYIRRYAKKLSGRRRSKQLATRRRSNTRKTRAQVNHGKFVVVWNQHNPSGRQDIHNLRSLAITAADAIARLRGKKLQSRRPKKPSRSKKKPCGSKCKAAKNLIVRVPKKALRMTN